MSKPEANGLSPPTPEDFGYRLIRFEFTNWGTFNKPDHVETLTVGGDNALLTGGNGAGKTTLVDGFQAIFVPPALRSYNKAGGVKRTERSDRTYVEGWYGQDREDSTQVRRLRGKGEKTLLLAVFANAATDETLALGAIFWVQNDDVDKLYVLRRSDTSISKHFVNLPAGRDLKKALRERGFEVFPAHVEFTVRFRALLRIPHESALSLFAQAVSMKDPENINTFVRKHMLEPQDMRQAIENLRQHFDDLVTCRDKIDEAERRQKLLEPIEAESVILAEREADLARWQEAGRAVRPFVAAALIRWTKAETATVEAEKQKVEGELRLVAAEVEALRTRERSLDLALQADSVHQHIERLEIQIAEQERLRVERQKNFDFLQQTLRSVGENFALTDEAGFTEALKRWQTRLAALEGELEAMRIRKVELGQRVKQLGEENRRAEDDLKVLAAQTSNIDPDWLRVRARICTATGIAPDQLPFAGELIEVRAEDGAWRGALERLLRPFALALLVPDTPAIYGKVVPFIKSNHLGLRLVFYKVPALSGIRLSFENDRRRAWGKLRVKEDHPLQTWLAREVRAQYDHVCCDTQAEFETTSRALTKDGLIAHSEHRREKDDRRPVGDAHDFMLGWSNRDKLSAMAQAIKLRAKEIETASGNVRSTEQTVAKKQPVAQALGIVVATASYERIDHATPASRVLALTHEKEKLEGSNKAYKQMKEDLADVRANLKSGEDRQRGKEAEITRHTTNLESLAAQRESKTALLVGEGPALVERHGELLTQQMGSAEITGRSADVIEAGLADKIDGTVSRRGGEVTKSRNRVLELMGVFQEKAHDPSLMVRIDSLQDFRDLLTRLVKDDLPTHRKRFNELMEKKVVYDAGKLSSELRDYSNVIEERITQLNVALNSIPYTDATYVQLRHQPTRNEEIMTFRKRLREATERATTWDDAQRTEAFNRINALLKDFDANPDWRNRVTDVRNWWEFSAIELTRADNEEVRSYWDSGGLSPGQKTKLAYTFLVAGLVFQYGLARDNPKSRTFRFVMVDEIFKGVDKDNAIYAMRLFREFGLQLLLVNPWNDEIMMIERQGFVASYHLVTNQNMCDSRLHTILRADLMRRLQQQLPAPTPADAHTA